MARIDDTQIQQLKRNVSLLHLCANRGIELKRHGSADYAGKCPLHDEDEASFIVTPSKNLWHCMGCGKGGSVIDLVMELEGITFRDAVDNLITSTGVISRGSEPASTTRLKKEKHPQESPAVPVERAAALLERAVTIYEKNLAESDQAQEYLDGRGLTDAGLLTRYRAGYSNGKLHDILPGNPPSSTGSGVASGEVRAELAAVGILLDPTGADVTPKRERFSGCVVFPVLDADGNLVTIYGRHTGNGKKRHVFLPGRSTGLWNAPAMKLHGELIVVESVLDGLSVEVAGFPNVVAAQGTNGLTERDISDMKHHGVHSLVLLLDGDDAGGKAAANLKPKLEAAGLTVSVKALPAEHDPNSYLIEHGAEALKRFLSSDAWTPSELSTPEPASPKAPSRAGADCDQVPGTPPATLSFTYGHHRYRVLGLERGPRKLKATVRVEHAGKLHVDTLDFYSARARRNLVQDLCRLFDETPERIEADINRLLHACENARVQAPGEGMEASAPPMTAAERREAEAFGRAPDLIERILSEMETFGLIGEKANKLLTYLAVTSRKLKEPLSVLVLSSSGAGKTALQDAALAFCPPEEMVKLTSLSGKALFYKQESSLKHKVLALEEGAGAEEASYAIRNLISQGELIVEAAIKDPATGKITTMINTVKGPTAVLLTTTNPQTDPETKSRFFITSVDESREQTRKILSFQRQRQTLQGLTSDSRSEKILTVHHNFQRLLKPLHVVNPLGEELGYGDDRLQGRRDQPKYLRLIRAIAFLRQMQKEIKRLSVQGSEVEYIEADADDIRLANKLAHEILGGSLDDISRPARALLLEVERMLAKRSEQCEEKARSRYTFTRRDVREFTGWSNYRVMTYLKELLELEYIVAESGRNGSLFRYRLLYDGQGKDGEKFLLGLKDPE